MASPLELLSRTILYEGYSLYPYRKSSIKNQYRWTLGVAYPPSYVAQNPAERSYIQAQCLVVGDRQTRLHVRARFLQSFERDCVDPRVVEREVRTILDLAEPYYSEGEFSFEAVDQLRLQGGLVVIAQLIQSGLFQLTIRLENDSHLVVGHDREVAVSQALLSSQIILHAEDGEFVSLTDPPRELQQAAEECCNVGTWPVLVGALHQPTALLCAPIILEDFPRIAPESPGDLFDGTEIDEILALRIQTLTPQEQREVQRDARTSGLLARTRRLNDTTMSGLHGTFRGTNSRDNGSTEHVLNIGGERVTTGSQVLLKPKRRADAFDIVLAGMTATVQSIETDFENNVLVSVTIDADPGSDFGEIGEVAHRFFFHVDEIVPISRLSARDT